MRMLFPDDGGAGGGAGGGNVTAPTTAAPASTSTPTASPSSSPSSPPASASPGSGGPAATSSSPLPFIEIPDMGDLDGFVDSTVKETPAAPVVEGGAATPPAPLQATPVVPGAPTQQATPAAAPAPVAPSPAATAPSATLPMSQQLTASMAVLIPQMAEADGFKLNEEEIAELDTNPVVALQKAQARTYVNALRYFHSQMETEIPKLIQAGVEREMAQIAIRDQTRTKVTGLLKAQFPSIDTNNPDHAQALSIFTRMHRQANPQATLEQLIQDVGMMVTSKLKLSATPAIVVPSKSTPMFAPANAGTQNGTGGTPPPENPFAGLALDLD